MSGDLNQLYIKKKLNPIMAPFVSNVLIDQPKDLHKYLLDYLMTHPSYSLSTSEKDELIHLRSLVKNPHISDSESVSNSNSESETVEELSPLPVSKKIPRCSVSAEAFGSWNRKSLFIAREIPKSPEQEQKIRSRLEKSFMFSSLDDKEKNVIIKAMEEKSFSPGQSVIRQGEEGNELFVVESGELECSKIFAEGDSRVLKQYYPGDSFGELALLYNVPRAASIKSVSESTCWVLDRECFNHIVKESSMRKREQYEKILENVELLKEIDSYEKMQIADALKSVSFEEGEFVIRQGDWGELFYIIEHGTATALKSFNGLPPVKVKEYAPGDYFGELSLIEGQPRAASIQASSSLKCVTLDRKGFKRMLGPVTEILKRKAKSYD